jgi:hypothetical protein
MLRKITAIASALALLCSSSASADAVHDALEAYALYQNDVSTLLDVDVENARTVDAARARLARHNSNQISRGWIAYGALTAAQSNRFASSIENRMRRDGRDTVLRALRDDVGYARRQQNSGQAVQLILSAASADSARAAQAGSLYDRFARSAGTVQLAATGRAELPGVTRLSPDMLDRLRGGGRVSQTSATQYGERGFWDAVAGRDGAAPRVRAGGEDRSYAPVTDHMLTLAAIVVADAERGERRRVETLLNEPLTQQCMHMQQLQLRQCLSVSVDAAERAYCLGQHALTGPGSCFASMVR